MSYKGLPQIPLTFKATGFTQEATMAVAFLSKEGLVCPYREWIRVERSPEYFSLYDILVAFKDWEKPKWVK